MNSDVQPVGSSVPGASFNDVVLPHLDAGRRLARWLMRNEPDAEDASWSRAQFSGHAFENKGQTWSWCKPSGCRRPLAVGARVNLRPAFARRAV